MAAVCSVIIPIKAPGQGKTRLAGVLRPSVREALVRTMAKRVVEAASACEAVARVFIAGGSDQGFGDRVSVLEDGGQGLNAALAAALKRLPAPSSHIIVAAADLPQIAPADFTMLAQLPDNAIGIAPDRHGTGTNALSLPWSCIEHFGFHFGPGSFAAHRAEARCLGYGTEVFLSDGLEKDIDEPADLHDAEDCMAEAL